MKQCLFTFLFVLFIDAAFAQDAKLIEAATLIGLAIPQSVLYRADRVIK